MTRRKYGLLQLHDERHHENESPRFHDRVLANRETFDQYQNTVRDEVAPVQHAGGPPLERRGNFAEQAASHVKATAQRRY
jgi:hypothetical protein